MIPQTLHQAIAEPPVPEWKYQLRNAITDVGELLALLGLGDAPIAGECLESSPFPLRVPRPFVGRMRRGDPDDPLLRQVLPLEQETLPYPNFVADPLAEQHYNPAPGVIHKYPGRVLLIASPVCAVNCRYCFRRHFPYEDNSPGKRYWGKSLAYLAAAKGVSEVILSGGDPLAADDRHLRWLVGEIEKIPHIKRLRIHTRLPVVIPSRIDQDCLAWMAESRLTLCVVLHINHGNEIDAEVAEMVARLRAQGIAVLNQSVLLKGVNDQVETLVDLSEKLFAAGVLPYYLHLLDPVEGAGHFQIGDGDSPARHLYRELQGSLPGYLLPKLVRDVPGEKAKVLIVPRWEE